LTSAFPGQTASHQQWWICFRFKWSEYFESARSAGERGIYSLRIGLYSSEDFILDKKSSLLADKSERPGTIRDKASKDRTYQELHHTITLDCY